MKAYLGKTKLKKDFVSEIKWHTEQDKVLQGTYGEGSNGDWRGCAVGCSIHSINRLKGKTYATNNHRVYETELGIPEWLASLEDTIFEGLPVEIAKQWPLRFSKAIKVGIDLEPVKWKFTAFILKENIERVLTLYISDDPKKQVVDAIRGVLTVTENAITSGVWDSSAARSAARSAESAARSAADSAGESAAWSAVESAAESAVWSVWSAADSAAWLIAAYERYADELIRLIKEVKRSPYSN